MPNPAEPERGPPSGESQSIGNARPRARQNVLLVVSVAGAN